ncbi:MAG: AbrB family transcriptional regulator [Ahrensia sp.]
MPTTAIMLLGPLFVEFGFPIAQMPDALLIAAQIFIGFSLGTRLRRENFIKLPRVAAAGVTCGAVLIVGMGLIVAPLIVAWTGAETTATILGTAPGGLGEMIASAKAVGASAAIVAGFQFVRSFITNIFVPPLVVRFGKSGGGAV